MPLQKIILVLGTFAALSLQPANAQMPVKPGVIRDLVSQAGAPRGASSTAVSANSSSAPKPTPVAAVSNSQGSKTPASAASGSKRDPFDPLLNKNPGPGGPAIPDRLPPGIAGLMIGSIHIDGLVNGPNGMIGIVSNPQGRVYFLRQGDIIFDGHVTKITLEAISFQQTGRDAFGNATNHEVVRRLYPNPGEQR